MQTVLNEQHSAISSKAYSGSDTLLHGFHGNLWQIQVHCGAKLNTQWTTDFQYVILLPGQMQYVFCGAQERVTCGFCIEKEKKISMFVGVCVCCLLWRSSWVSEHQNQQPVIKIVMTSRQSAQSCNKWANTPIHSKTSTVPSPLQKYWNNEARF